MDLQVTIDADALLNQMSGDIQNMTKEIGAAVEKLSVITHAHILEQAAEKLHARQQMFTKALRYEKVDDHTWSVIIPQEVRWIEDGMDAHSMLPALLRSKKAKTAADGSRYVVVPFKHNDASRQRGPSQSSAFAKQLTNQIRGELRRRGIAYQKPIERDAGGKPKLGLLHSFDIMNSPKRPHWTSPALQGVRVYQRMVKDAKGRESVSRDVMTFRVASSKHAGQKWEHPGLTKMGFLEEAQQWAMRTWAYEILPSLMAKYGSR